MLQNVFAINKAVSGDGRKRTLYVDAGRAHGRQSTPERRSLSGVLRTAPVDTITLEQLFQEHGIQHCRLLKIIAPGAVEETLEESREVAASILFAGKWTSRIATG